MLDVHAPEHPISNVREFLIHLFTITCGLLIALALENAAEALHHRHERQEAETMIRQELRANQRDAQKSAPLVAEEVATMKMFLGLAQAQSEGGEPIRPDQMKLEFTEGELGDAAWRTASSTGVLSFMEYTEVEKFAAAYKEQDLLQTTLENTLNDYLQLTSVISPYKGPGKLTQQRATEALPYIRKTLGDLNGVMAIGQGTLASYKEALQ